MLEQLVDEQVDSTQASHVVHETVEGGHEGGPPLLHARTLSLDVELIEACPGAFGVREVTVARIGQVGGQVDFKERLYHKQSQSEYLELLYLRMYILTWFVP